MYQSVLVRAHTKAIWTYQSSLHNFQTHFPTPYITTDNITRFTNFGFKLYRGIWRYFFSFLLNFFFFSFTDWCYENPSTCDTSQKVLSPPPHITQQTAFFAMLPNILCQTLTTDFKARPNIFMFYFYVLSEMIHLS